MTRISIHTNSGGTPGECKNDPGLKSWFVGNFAYDHRILVGEDLEMRDLLLRVTHVSHDIARNTQNVTVDWFPESDWMDAL